MAEFELYTASVCPFAQRTRIVAAEKSIPLALVEVDLNDKPVWFRSVSPYEKVPVLKHGPVRVYESSIINEYLDEVVPARALMPSDPAGRALARIWVNFADTKFVTAFYRMLLIQEPRAQEYWVDQFRSYLLFIEEERLRASDSGPYFLGRELTLADIAFHPHFERLGAVKHYRGVTLPERCTRLRSWIETMQSRPSVAILANPDEFYICSLADYAFGSASGTTARDIWDA